MQQEVKTFGFGEVIAGLKLGKRFARTGWNGKHMWIVLVPGTVGLKVNEGAPLAKAGLPIGLEFNYLPHIDMWTAQGELVPWLASQSDMLAEDWTEVPSEEWPDEEYAETVSVDGVD